MKMTTSKTFETKTNICGLTKLTAGQNLIKAITGADAPIGILECRYDELFKIFALALTPEEIDLVDKGYGFRCERLSQKEIAAQLNVMPIEVSTMMHVCIEKLKRSPFKSQIKKLSASVEDVEALIKDLSSKELVRVYNDELAHKYNNAVEMAKRSDAVAEAAKAEASKLSYDNQKLQEQNAELKKQLDKAAALCAKLSGQAEKVKVLEATLRSAANSLNKAVSALDVNKEGDELKDLGLIAETRSALASVGIHTVEKLCSLSSQNLSKLGLGSYVKEISMKLKRKGLHLRNVA